MSIIRVAIMTGALAVLAACLHYLLPQVDVVHAVGVETKRVDQVDETNTERTKDVYFIQTEVPETRKPSVYRNEDNLFYLKWASADIQAKSQSLAADKQLIAVRHYGWRIRFLSMFPNALDVWPVEDGYRHFPLFNTIFLILLGGLGFLSYRKWKRLGASLTHRRQRRRDAAASRRQESPASSAPEDAGDIEEFLSSGQEIKSNSSD